MYGDGLIRIPIRRLKSIALMFAVNRLQELNRIQREMQSMVMRTHSGIHSGQGRAIVKNIGSRQISQKLKRSIHLSICLVDQEQMEQ